MREFVKAHRFSPEANQLVRKCVEIVESYQGQGLKLTLRQLYYQLVSANVIKNEERQYKKLSSLLSDARLMGRIDWDAIEDRIRVPRVPQEFKNLQELVDAALNSYRLDRWKGQENYVEVWIEKDALAGIVAPIAREYHVTMMVNRGYSSQSAMYDAAKRFLKACHGEDLPYKTGAELYEGKDADEKMLAVLKKINVLDAEALSDPPPRNPILLYLGDHDPSGEDMVRDIGARLSMFGIEVDVRKLALTIDQVHEYDPPPNPAKMTDPRAEEYVDKHGATSWEVDALRPDVLDQLIRDSLESVIDMAAMDKVKRLEKRDKAILAKALKSLRK